MAPMDVDGKMTTEQSGVAHWLSAFKDLESKFSPLVVEVKSQRERGFSGAEAAVVVLTFIILETAKGMLSKLGQEIWERLKRLHTGSQEETPVAPPRSIRIRIMLKGDAKRVVFICQFRQNEHGTVAKPFLEAVAARAGAESSSDTNGATEMEFAKDGAWTVRRR
jgi:hypothetical protein